MWLFDSYKHWITFVYTKVIWNTGSLLINCMYVWTRIWHIYGSCKLVFFYLCQFDISTFSFSIWNCDLTIAKWSIMLNELFLDTPNKLNLQIFQMWCTLLNGIVWLACEPSIMRETSKYMDTPHIQKLYTNKDTFWRHFLLQNNIYWIVQTRNTSEGKGKTS